MTVKLYGCVIDEAGGHASYVPNDCSDVRQLIDELGDCFGSGFKDFLLGGETCLFLVNGSGILQTGGLDMKLERGDRIEILPFVIGG